MKSIIGNPARHLKITHSILFILLAMGMIVPFTDFAYGLLRGSDSGISLLVEWFGLRIVEPWIFPTLINFSPVLVAIAMLSNRENLQNMNVDKPYVVLSIYSGLIIAWSFFLPVGWLSGVANFCLLIALLAGILVFGNVDYRTFYSLNLLMIVGFLVFICITSGRISVENTGPAIKQLYSWPLSTYVYEEFIYRGLLWMYLKGRNWQDSTIVLFQAFLFWISHLSMTWTNPVWYFTVVPTVSLLLGYLVLRTKSLTTSTIAHVTYNLLIVLLS